MMKIVVTGGAGFIGSHLVNRLVQTQAGEIVVVDNCYRGNIQRLQSYISSGAIKWINGDIRDRNMLLKTFEYADIVFHLAAQSNVLGAVNDIDYSFKTNVIGTFNVLRAAKMCGVKTVVFSSSREVYGEAQKLPVGETSLLLAKNSYGASKIAGEAYCRVFNSSQMSVIVRRLANVYGLGDHDRVIPIFMERSKKKLPLEIYGGKQTIDFISVDIVVNAMIKSGEMKPTIPINIGSGKGTSIKDLALRILASTNNSNGFKVLPARSVEVVKFIADVHKMNSLLGIISPNDPLIALDGMLEQ